MGFLKFLLGFVIAITLLSFFGERLLLLVPLAVVGIAAQLAFARLLNSFLGGDDPVRGFGAKNLQELRRCVPVPLRITLLDLLAKSCFYAIAGVLIQYLFFRDS